MNSSDGFLSVERRERRAVEELASTHFGKAKVTYSDPEPPFYVAPTELVVLYITAAINMSLLRSWASSVGATYL